MPLNTVNEAGFKALVKKLYSMTSRKYFGQTAKSIAGWSE
jgi:hypothetical protein